MTSFQSTEVPGLAMPRRATLPAFLITEIIWLSAAPEPDKAPEPAAKPHGDLSAANAKLNDLLGAGKDE